MRSLLLGETVVVLGGCAAGAVAGLKPGPGWKIGKPPGSQGTAQVGGLGAQRGHAHQRAISSHSRACRQGGGLRGGPARTPASSRMNLGAVTAPAWAGGLVGSPDRAFVE